MPTFCRHNRFIERCPICSKTLPGNAEADRPPRARSSSTRTGSDGQRAARSRTHGQGRHMRVQREARAVDDGYRSELVPGLRASADAYRLAEELAFASDRLLTLAAQPPELYGELRALGAQDLERATWGCFLIAYLCPLEGEDPWVGIRAVIETTPEPPISADQLPDLAEVPLGPYSSHEPTRGADTLIAYTQWAQRAAETGEPAPGAASAGTQARAFNGDSVWSPERRFERLFERLALPGLARIGRYELLVVLGRLGLYELLPDSLQLAGARGLAGDDPTTLAAKRVFGIGDPLLLERRAAALAQEAGLPIDALDLALANWAAPRPATLGFSREGADADAFERVGAALGL
jgi:hypothetical protein